MEQTQEQSAPFSYDLEKLSPREKEVVYPHHVIIQSLTAAMSTLPEKSKERTILTTECERRMYMIQRLLEGSAITQLSNIELHDIEVREFLHGETSMDVSRDALFLCAHELSTSSGRRDRLLNEHRAMKNDLEDVERAFRAFRRSAAMLSHDYVSRLAALLKGAGDDQ